MDRPSPTGRSSVVVPGLFLILLFALKVIYVFWLRIDSDETQHLHVVWGWANGLLPYRDLFDNHSPLFQFIYAPLFRLLGERADIVVPMRFAVIPLYLLCLWIVYRCGASMFSQEVGLWAAVLAGAFPTFFIKSCEFRTDDLWAVCWLLTILATCQRLFTASRAFLCGLTLGAGFATSMKTTVLGIGLLVAVLTVLAIRIALGNAPRWSAIARLAGFGLLGAVVFPAGIIAFFTAHGALTDLYYGTIKHNIVPYSHIWIAISRKLVWFIPVAALIITASRTTWKRTTEVWKRDRIVLVAASVLAYFVLLALVWSIVQTQDFLPTVPVVALLTAAAIATGRWRDRQQIILSSVAAGELLLLVAFQPPHPQARVNKESMIRAVLDLTTPNEFVMDAKGETVYRRRPFYYVLEGITNRRLAEGLIKDDIPERLVTTRTPVASLLRMPPRAHDFIEQNYLPVAFRTRVAGKLLANQDGHCRFEIALPQTYTLIAEAGPITAATLDGTPFSGPRFLGAGVHELQIGEKTGPIAVIWDRAVAKGFSPFRPMPKEELKAED